MFLNVHKMETIYSIIAFGFRIIYRKEQCCLQGIDQFYEPHFEVDQIDIEVVPMEKYTTHHLFEEPNDNTMWVHDLQNHYEDRIQKVRKTIYVTSSQKTLNHNDKVKFGKWHSLCKELDWSGLGIYAWWLQFWAKGHISHNWGYVFNIITYCRNDQLVCSYYHSISITVVQMSLDNITLSLNTLLCLNCNSLLLEPNFATKIIVLLTNNLY